MLKFKVITLKLEDFIHMETDELASAFAEKIAEFVNTTLVDKLAFRVAQLPRTATVYYEDSNTIKTENKL